ncbi:uncharacterized protein LOC101889169 [Musca domestica]|uniref:Uncharacterized protein LOC101889169 n=1 Tax=Musca domestica TaxID=7370 RepID=A0A1I8NE47_MUSDO|nr:uncharacterized protein LOC101889169 [Musca domestica]
MLNLFYFAVIFTVLCQSLHAAPSSPGDILTSAERTHIRSVLDETKENAGRMVEIIGKVLPQLPKSPDYDEVQKNLEEFQQIAKEFYEVKCRCRKKAMQFFDYFSQFLENYSENGVLTVEEKEAGKLLDDSGLKEMRENFQTKKAKGEYEYLTD